MEDTTEYNNLTMTKIEKVLKDITESKKGKNQFVLHVYGENSDKFIKEFNNALTEHLKTFING